MAGEMMVAGSAFGPWGTAAGAALDLAKGAKGGTAMPAGPSRADFGASFGFDNSGWTVATGQGKASATSIPWMAIAAAAVVVLILLRKK